MEDERAVVRCLKTPLFDSEMEMMTKDCDIETEDSVLEGYPHVIVREERFIDRKTKKVMHTVTSYLTKNGVQNFLIFDID